MQETIFGLTPSPNLSPKGERNLRFDRELYKLTSNPL
jgi:hypothetical protein